MTAQSEHPYLRSAVAKVAGGETEAQYRRRLVANLRAEGCDDATVARLSDDKTVRKMKSHQDRAVAAIAGLFGAMGGRT